MLTVLRESMVVGIEVVLAVPPKELRKSVPPVADDPATEVVLVSCMIGGWIGRCSCSVPFKLRIRRVGGVEIVRSVLGTVPNIPSSRGEDWFKNLLVVRDRFSKAKVVRNGSRSLGITYRCTRQGR